MKKSILFFALVFVFTSFLSQNWCPPGAKWHIKRGGDIGDLSGTKGVIEMSYTTNTIVIGMPCKRLDAVFKGDRPLGLGGGFNISENYNTYYTYSSNNVIFLYNGSNAFDTLIYFNALPGDKWLKPRSVQTGCLSRSGLTVADTSHVTINGFYLKQLKIVDSGTVIVWSGPSVYTETYNCVERILFLNFLSQNLFPTNCEFIDGLYDGPFNTFRCYEDNVFPLYKNASPGFSWSGKPCDYTTGIETIENNNINLSLYPNPNDGNFQLELQQPTEITIYNMLGERVYNAAFKQTGTVAIETAFIVPGAFILKAKTAEGNGQMKFIRQ